MERAIRTGRSFQFLLYAAALVVTIAGLRAFASIAILLLVAAFLATIAAPAVMWLQRKRLPPVVAVLLVVLAMIGIVTVLGFVVGASINGFVKAVPSYKTRVNQQVGRVLTWLEDAGAQAYVVDQLKGVDAGALMGLVGTAFSAMGSLFGNSLIIMLIVTFVLLEVSSFPIKLRAAFGEAQAPMMERLRQIATNVERYVALKTIISLVTGLGIGLWVAMLGLDFPVLWGLLAFVLNYIPTFGSLVAAVPAVILGLVLLGPAKALLIAVGYLVVNLVMGNIIEPRVMGRGLGLSTLIVFLSLLFWGWVLGVAGTFLAAPLTMALRIVLDSHEGTRWIAVLMGPADRSAAAGEAPESRAAAD